MLDAVEGVMNVGCKMLAALFLLLWVSGIIFAGITSVYIVIGG